MKKGQTESYSFLIGIIITFLMMTAVGCVIYKTYSGKAETEKTFKLLVDQLNGLKEGEEGESPFFIEEQKVLVGFDQDKDELSIEEDCGDWKLPIQIKKPKAEICKKEACLCLCNLQTDGGEVSEETCAVASCKGIKTASFFRGGKTCSGVFISGKTAEGKVRTLAFKIEGGILYLGEESVNERIKKVGQQELEGKASEVFTSTHSIFNKCYESKKEDCLCGELDYSTLPKDFKIKMEELLEVADIVLTYTLGISLINPEKEVIKKSEQYPLYSLIHGAETTYANVGVLCSSSEKIDFAYGCKGILFSAKGLEFYGGCCKNLRDWTPKTKLSLIRDKEGIYLTIDPKRLDPCF